jgi:hypothetical protein
MMSKLDLAVIVGALLGVMLWVEHEHRIDIEPMTFTLAAACPENDNLPYSQDCLVFMDGGGTSALRLRNSAPAAPSSYRRDASLTAGAPCPTNDNVPYGANCVAFLSGWRWHADQ